MKPYNNGLSGVGAYEYGEDWIVIEFKTGKRYKYTYQSAGSQHIENMKRLADDHSGLNRYVLKNVRNNYVR